MRFAVVGGDMRLARLAGLLRVDGHRVLCTGLERGEARCVPLAEALEGADHVILPLPAGGGETVNAPLAESPISVDELTELMTPRQTLFAGKVEGRLSELCRARGIRCFDYFDREELTVRNAAATVEGALEILMRELPATLLGTPVLVIGFGRIGKLLALRLHLLGARVTASARKPADRAWIECLGMESADTGALETVLPEFAAVVNTVPAPVLDEKRLALLRRDCLCLDLASKPGGVDFDAARRLGVRTEWALGLPGKTAPETAGAAIRDTVYNIINENNLE